MALVKDTLHYSNGIYHWRSIFKYMFVNK